MGMGQNLSHWHKIPVTIYFRAGYQGFDSWPYKNIPIFILIFEIVYKPHQLTVGGCGYKSWPDSVVQIPMKTHHIMMRRDILSPVSLLLSSILEVILTHIHIYIYPVYQPLVINVAMENHRF